LSGALPQAVLIPVTNRHLARNPAHHLHLANENAGEAVGITDQIIKTTNVWVAQIRDPAADKATGPVARATNAPAAEAAAKVAGEAKADPA